MSRASAEEVSEAKTKVLSFKDLGVKEISFQV